MIKNLIMSIQFFFTETKVIVPERKRLKTFIKNIFKKENKKLTSLLFIFCSDEYLLNINRRFLQHDYYTDIITFNLSDTPKIIEGEIYISTDRIKHNALLMRVSNKHELHRIIFHGILHLCGYKDKPALKKKAMTSLEDACLAKYFQLN